MKTRYVLLALVLLCGFSILVAFKQDDKTEKYVTVSLISPEGLGTRYASIVDENSQQSYRNDFPRKESDDLIINKLVNEFAGKGYKVIQMNSFSVSLQPSPRKEYVLLLKAQ